MRIIGALPRRCAALGAAFVAALAVLVATTTPAHAFTTYTPTGGPNVRFVGTGITFTDIPAAQSFGCSTFEVAGPVVSSGTSRTYGAAAATLSSVTAGGCSNAMCGTIPATPSVPWHFAITGDQSGGTWPARITGVKAQFTCVGFCQFTLSGEINGRFDATTRRFTPSPGASGVVVASSPPPTGLYCTTIDVLAGDAVAVGGYWTNLPPAGSTSPAITNP